VNVDKENGKKKLLKRRTAKNSSNVRQLELWKIAGRLERE